MVTCSTDSLLTVAKQVLSISGVAGRYTCCDCLMCDLSEDELWQHFPLYHINTPNPSDDLLAKQKPCPICKIIPQRPMQVHIRNKHGPPGRGERESEDVADAANLYPFAMVVCTNKEGQFLLVQEFANSGFWFPGGRVDATEPFEKAAVRETKEEAGVDVELTGIIRIEFSTYANKPHSAYSRMRIFFAARPVDESKAQHPKTEPDYESAGAVWISPEELSGLKLRGTEPLQWIPYVTNGGSIYPMSLLTAEGVTAPTVHQTKAAPSHSGNEKVKSDGNTNISATSTTTMDLAI